MITRTTRSSCAPTVFGGVAMFDAQTVNTITINTSLLFSPAVMADPVVSQHALETIDMSIGMHRYA